MILIVLLYLFAALTTKIPSCIAAKAYDRTGYIIPNHPYIIRTSILSAVTGLFRPLLL